LMFRIDKVPIPATFIEAWKSAAAHLRSAGSGHLSFYLGNQLFFVFVEAVLDGGVILPFESRAAERFLDSAEVAKAIPCRLRIVRTVGGWQVSPPGWGMVHAESGQSIEPPALVDDRQIEMSDWELHDFGIEVVRNYLSDEGMTVAEWQSNLRIDPSIWFQDGERLCWAVVRSVRYPAMEAPRPVALDKIRASCDPYGDNGYFASVSAANSDDPFDGKNPMPLFRGCGMYVRFTGVEPV
jgi:hypothetical protein